MIGRLRTEEAGFSAPIMILILAFMVAIIGGISIDLWRIIEDHREVTGLADGAAIAGATAVDIPAFEADPTADPILDPALAVQRVCDYMRSHGEVATCPSATLTVDFASDLTGIEVTYQRDVALTLLRAVEVGGADPVVVYAESFVELERGTPVP
ncbi:MAG: hypothetical protein HKN91_02355 [Acidimicrobiia bacterium]|nr:hypothetical protein [Acidimicrobiia bacterium]